jgi:prepilin-type N-terminal cleavage/methylation domain-containing protein
MNKELRIMGKTKKRTHNTYFMIHDSGLSLLEVLVVVALFAVLGIVISRSIILTLQGSQKSESLVRARENLDYSLAVIERQIRNATSITECPNTDTNIINYTDQNGRAGSFSCVNVGQADSYVASGSARLTSDAVSLVTCSFTCTLGTGDKPPVVAVDLEVKNANASGAQSSVVSATTQIYLRSY